MNEKESLAAFFDKKAARFDAIYSGQHSSVALLWDRLTRRNMAHRFTFAVKMLSPLIGKQILDVGCGSGRYCVAFAQRGARAVGVALSPCMLDLARQLAVRQNVPHLCSFIQSDITSFASEQSSDAVVAMGFFDYTPDPSRILTHLLRLRWEMLLASFPAAASIRTPFRRLWLDLHGCPARFYTHAQVVHLCRHAGLVCQSLIRTGPIYLLVARRGSTS